MTSMATSGLPRLDRHRRRPHLIRRLGWTLVVVAITSVSTLLVATTLTFDQSMSLVSRGQQQKGAAAEATFRHVIALAPDDFNAWDGLARALAQQSRFAEALVAHDRAIGLFPYHVDIQFSKATTLTEMGDYDGAIAMLEAIGSRRYGRMDRPNELVQHFLTVYRHQNAHQKIVDLLAGPSSADGLLAELRADALVQLNRFGEAMQDYARAQQLGGGGALLGQKIANTRTRIGS
jgi:cytochrome c-type biogenesis protein CcmH/NrfG